MKEKQKVLDFLKSHKSEFQEKFGVVKIALFGSVARDEDKEDSDIDIVVEIESDNKFRSFFEFKYYLEKHLKRKIDLGIESAIKKAAMKEIKKDLIYV